MPIFTAVILHDGFEAGAQAKLTKIVDAGRRPRTGVNRIKNRSRLAFNRAQCQFEEDHKKWQHFCPDKMAVFTAVVMIVLYSSGAATASAATFTVPKAERCGATGAATCATFSDSSGAEQRLELFTGEFSQVDAGLMGTYQIAGVTAPVATSMARSIRRSSMAMHGCCDRPDRGRKIAWVAAPAGYGIGTYGSTLSAAPAASAGRSSRPAPITSITHSTETGAYKAPIWNFLCLFDPAAIAHPDPSCHVGFRTTARGSRRRAAPT